MTTLATRIPPIAAFLALAVTANLLTNAFAPMPIGFGLTVTAGTWAAGLVLLARDWVDHTSGRWAILACIAAGAGLSWSMTTAFLAIASAAAFAISELADWAVYRPLLRKGWGKAAFWSGVAGSAVDTAVFLWLAPFDLTWPAFSGQMLAKVGITFLFVVAAKAVSRGVLRNRQRTASA